MQAKGCAKSSDDGIRIRSNMKTNAGDAHATMLKCITL